MDKNAESKIGELQMIEQNLQRFVMQRQSSQAQLMEVENALGELSKSEGNCYKIVGNVMVSSDKDTLVKDLEDKKEVVSLKMKSFEKQENEMKEKANDLQAEVLKFLESQKNE